MAQEGVYVFPDSQSGRGNIADYATIAALNANNGWGGGMNNPMWMMFMYPFILPFLSMFGNGWGGFGGWGGNGAAAAADVAGTGFISNQLTNIQGRDLILQALNGRADAIAQLAQITNSSVDFVKAGLADANAKLSSIGERFGLTALQVINEVQNGNATLGRQLCECCCENRLATANQTATLQAEAARNANAAQFQLAQHDANVRLQLAEAKGDQNLAICQQTNTLQNQAERDTTSILNAIANQNTMITKEFCDLKERELQNKIDTQGDIITQLRNQISNDKQTLQFNAAFHALDDKIDAIAAKQPNTVPVQWPNLVAANATPYVGYNYGAWGQTNFWN